MNFKPTTKNKMKRRQRPSQNRRGSAAVEMAFVLPIFLTLVFGCMEFSRISMIRNLTANAAYEAARYAMVQGGSEGDATFAANSVIGRLGLVGGVVAVRFEDDDGVATTEAAARRVNVRVDIPYSKNGFFAGFLPESISNLTLTSQVTLRTNRHTDDDNF